MIETSFLVSFRILRLYSGYIGSVIERTSCLSSQSGQSTPFAAWQGY